MEELQFMMFYNLNYKINNNNQFNNNNNSQINNNNNKNNKLSNKMIQIHLQKFQ